MSKLLLISNYNCTVNKNKIELTNCIKTTVQNDNTIHNYGKLLDYQYFHEMFISQNKSVYLAIRMTVVWIIVVILYFHWNEQIKETVKVMSVWNKQINKLGSLKGEEFFIVLYLIIWFLYTIICVLFFTGVSL